MTVEENSNEDLVPPELAGLWTSEASLFDTLLAITNSPSEANLTVVCGTTSAWTPIQPNGKMNLVLSPVPVDRTMDVHLPVGWSNTARLEVRSANGRTVDVRSVTGPDASMDLSNLAPGIYSLYAIAPGKSHLQRMFIKQ